MCKMYSISFTEFSFSIISFSANAFVETPPLPYSELKQDVDPSIRTLPVKVTP